MKVQSNRIIEVTLILTEEEAKWLKTLMQNPLVDANFNGQETPQEADMRRRYWDALNSGLTMGIG